MAHDGLNEHGPHENSPLLLNMFITSYRKLTGVESHLEDQRLDFHCEEEESDNRGEVLILYRTDGVISLRQEGSIIMRRARKVQ